MMIFGATSAAIATPKTTLTTVTDEYDDNVLYITTTCWMRPCEIIKERDIVTNPDHQKPYAKLPMLDVLMTTPVALWLRSVDTIHVDGVMTCNILNRLLPLLKRFTFVTFDSWWTGELYCLEFNLRQYNWVRELETNETNNALNIQKTMATGPLEITHVEVYPNTFELCRGAPTAFKIHGQLFYHMTESGKRDDTISGITDDDDDGNTSTSVDTTTTTTTTTHVLYLFKSPPHRVLTDPPRVIEALTSISSMLHYRTCPVTVHIAGNLHDKQTWFDPYFRRNYDPDVDFHFIDLNKHPIEEYYLHGLPSFRESGHRDARLKLVVDRLMPLSVKQVLVLDYDTLVLDDICQMTSSVFRNMNKTGSAFIAMAGEMAVYYVERPAQHLIAFPGTKSMDPQHWNGLNSGVIFMNLEEMRRQHWSDLWMNDLQYAKQMYREAVPSIEWFLFELGDQNMFNFVFRLHPNYFLELDNTYNFQLFHISNTNPALLRSLVCQHADHLKILHGNSYTFMDDESILKKQVWNTFLDSALPSYTRGTYTHTYNTLQYNNNNNMNRDDAAKSHQAIVGALQDWQHCF